MLRIWAETCSKDNPGLNKGHADIVAYKGVFIYFLNSLSLVIKVQANGWYGLQCVSTLARSLSLSLSVCSTHSSLRKLPREILAEPVVGLQVKSDRSGNLNC
jgi:hypothetical protein